MTRFIILAGRKQTGKDTSAHLISEILARQWQYTYPLEFANGRRQIHIVHFADALKDACAMIFGIDRQDMVTEEGKKKLTDVKWPLLTHDGYVPFGNHSPYTPEPPAGSFMTVREILQFVGTDLFRTQIDPDIWVKSVFRRKYGPDDVVIVADARFPNECLHSKANGLLVKLERDTGELSKDMHVSETALDDYNDYDAIIVNNHDLVVLEQKLVILLREHRFIE